MTPSSTSEPGLEGQPAKTGPDETIDPTSKAGAPDVAVVSESEAGSEAETVAEPVAETAVTTKVPVTEPEPATAEPTTTVQPVAETVPIAKDETAEPAPAQAKPAQPAPIDVATPTEVDAMDDGEGSDDGDNEDEDNEDDDDAEYDEVLGSDPEPSNRYPTLIPLVGSLLGLTAIAALMLVAFALPVIKSSPNKLPIGVSGTAEFQTQVRAALSQEGLTPFEITGYTKESELRSAILDREVYGGLSLGTESVSMLVSSGASPIAAQTLNSLANSLAQGGIPVSDVAPLPKSDPRGDGLAAANLPLVIAAILPTLILIPLYRRRTAAQLGVTVGAAALIGLGLSAVLSFALGSTEDSNFVLVSVGLAAGVLATSLVLLGLFAVLGRIGAGVGAAVLVLFAAPLTGLSTAPEWLPGPWGSIGQLLPPGANASLLRSTAYFDGNGGGRPALILAAWALVGLLLIGLGWLLQRRRTQEPVPEPEPAVQELVLEQPATV